MVRQPGSAGCEESIPDIVANWKTYDSTKRVRRARAGALLKSARAKAEAHVR